MYMQRFFWIGLTCWLSLTACRKDTDVFVPDPTGTSTDTPWVTALRTPIPVQQDIFLPPTKDTITFFGTTTTALLAKTGLRYLITMGQWVDSNGVAAPLSNAVLESYWLTSRGNMIRANLPASNSSSLIIDAVGIASTSIRTASGTLLRLNNNSSLSFFANSNANANTLVTLSNQTWLVQNDSLNAVSGNGQQLTVRTNQPNWLAVGTTAIPAVVSQVEVRLPATFGNANAVVYIVPTSHQWIMELPGDATSRTFRKAGIPYSNGMRAVVIAKQNNAYYWANAPVSLSGATNVVLSMTPVAIPFAALLQELNNL